jgi:signal transduction histidine kinase
MAAVYFIYGLAFFSLGLTVALEARRASRLPLGRQLPWLAAFGLTHCLVEWTEMFLFIGVSPLQEEILKWVHIILLPVSAVMLVIFGVGLIKEAGELPSWLDFAPVVLLVPVGLLLGYATIIFLTDPPLYTAMDVWSRYLLYLPGCVLSALGFWRQWKRLSSGPLQDARTPLLGAASVFLLNAVVAGLIVPEAEYGLAPWLNYTTLDAATGIPVQIWRAASAILMMVLVMRSLNVFETERRIELAEIEADRTQAQQAYLQAQEEARQLAEDWTETLVEINRQVVNMQDLDEVLQGIVKAARRLLEADTGALALWDEDRQYLQVKSFATRESITSLDARVTRSFILKAVAEGNIFHYPRDAGAFVDPWICAVLGVEIQTALIVPLQLEGESIGGLWVGRRAGGPFTALDANGLTRLADQAVIAIEHSILAAQMQSVAVLEERSRIAREMHDGLSQILGYLSLETQTLEALVEQGDQQTIRAELQQARSSIRAAQADVRENILSLRTTLAGESGLFAALQEYLAEFGCQTGLQANLSVETEEPVRLSPLAEVQLMRIVQEALSNVRKHAQASQVLVRIASHDDYLALTITDDGVGFDSPAGNGHYGLLTMRERAESAGGGLTVTSESGLGTQVNLWLPIQNLKKRNGSDLAEGLAISGETSFK